MVEIMKSKITEKEAKEMYNEMLDEQKENWILNYYGGTAFMDIDPIAYNVGFTDYVDSISEDYEIEGFNDEVKEDD